MKYLIAAGLLAAGAAHAQDAGYSDHPGVVKFTEEPCGSVLETLDGDQDQEILEAFSERGLTTESVNQLAGDIGSWTADYGMTWGFILGFDTARGGLSEDGKTTLERFRARCEDDPEQTGYEILDDFKASAGSSK